MTSNQCGVPFSDIDLLSLVYHNVHGHPEFIVSTGDFPWLGLSINSVVKDN